MAIIRVAQEYTVYDRARSFVCAEHPTDAQLPALTRPVTLGVVQFTPIHDTWRDEDRGSRRTSIERVESPESVIIRSERLVCEKRSLVVLYI